MAEPLPKHYDPQEIEPRWYQTWRDAGYFHAESTAPYLPFCIVYPPPNITGVLHLGHALTTTIQDILVRWKRMQGCNTLWVPGTDHAGIATQTVVERELRKEGKSRHDLGREKFLERVWAWKEKHGSRITEQLGLLGASFDWRRERFTMSPELSKAVTEAFVQLYEQNLIYRAERLINWCPRCRTALSDLEVESKEEPGELFHFAYPIEGDNEVVVATTRPETMLGDTAVAVHPDDERYKALIGKRIKHPFVDRTFAVISDAELVDMEFGTGAVKVTPAHDPNDFDAGKRNNLPMVNILNIDGTLNEEAGPFNGMDRFAARKKVKEQLEAKGLARATEAHKIAVPRCQRCETVLEPMLSLQWFVEAETLAKPAIEAVERGDTNFVPQYWAKTYFHWMRNIREWCISRQLWWGHRIPAWYCADGHATVARETPAACAECQKTELTQDEDVLDTWFSSALWPFSTLGWPAQTPELRTFYPTSVMETGYDILFFWVARMMMMGLHFMQKVPFKTVVLHSMIVDERGEKMSKVRGNVVDPAEVTAKYGADALRFGLAWMSTPAAQGRPIKFSMRRIEESRNFCTKMWNAGRLALMNLEDYDPDAFTDSVSDGPSPYLSLADKWILSRVNRTAAAVDKSLDEYRFNEMAQRLHGFFWGELCDWYLEMAKPALRDQGSQDEGVRRRAAQGSLATTLDTALRLLHPVMPFVTEEIWLKLPRPDGSPQSLLITVFPACDERFLDSETEKAVELLQALTTEVRALRALYRVPHKATLKAVVVTRDEWTRNVVAEHGKYACDLARLEEITIAEERPPRDDATAIGGVGEFEVLLRLEGSVDVEAERAHIAKELEKRAKELQGVEKKLADENFTTRAPASVVDEWRQRSRALGETIRRLREATRGS